MADLRDYKNKDFSITVNTRMNGIELRFENTMTEEQIEQIKEAGFRWSKHQQMWYAYQNEKTIEYANSLKTLYEENPIKEEIKEKKAEPSQVEKTVQLEDLIAELREEIRLQKEKIKELETIIEEKNNGNEEILLEAENGEKMTIEELNQWNEEQEMQKEIDDLEEGKNFINSLELEEDSEIILTEEDLEICRKIIPQNQYAYTLELTQGEEGDFYKQKLKDIANIAQKMTTNDELVNEDGSHNVAFHYFVGNTDFYISQLYPDGSAFGYTILNGDLQMAGWGYQNIEEIINASQWIEMDYHIPEGMTIERMLEESYPTYYKKESHVEIENKFIPSFNVLNEKYAMEFEPAEEGKIEVTSEADKWIVKFYDISKAIPGENDKGRFIQSYYASSLLQNQNSNVGLNLGYGWRLDAETFNYAKELIKDFVNQKENIIEEEHSESISKEPSLEEKFKIAEKELNDRVEKGKNLVKSYILEHWKDNTEKSEFDLWATNDAMRYVGFNPEIQNYENGKYVDVYNQEEKKELEKVNQKIKDLLSEYSKEFIKSNNINKLSESTINYIKKVTDSWDKNNWQVIDINHHKLDALNFYHQYFTDYYSFEMNNNSQLLEERTAALKNISEVAKHNGKSEYDFIDETIKNYLVEKHGYEIWDYDEVKKHEGHQIKLFDSLNENEKAEAIRLYWDAPDPKMYDKVIEEFYYQKGLKEPEPGLVEYPGDEWIENYLTENEINFNTEYWDDIFYQLNLEEIEEYSKENTIETLDISDETKAKLSEVSSQIKNYVEKGIIPKNQRFTLPNSPEYLRKLGADDTEISLPVSVVKKAIEKHNLSLEEINNSIHRLYDPIFAFDKKEGENNKPSLLMITDEFHIDGEKINPVVLALNINDEIRVKHHTVEVQDVRTVFDKQLTAVDGTNLVEYWSNSGFCKYANDKKITDWNRITRNLFPIELLQSAENNILLKSDLVNNQEHHNISQSQNTNEPHTKKEIKNIREQCREILQKSDNEITEEDKLILAQYEGGGGINEENRTSAQVLNEFYTPNNLIEKVWNLVDAYNPNGKTVLEPTAGIGKFANNRPNNQFTMHELDETSARINKILHPEANIIQGAYQKQFLDETGRVRNPDFVQPKYDIVIGNPPYGEYSGQYKAIEGKHHQRYEEYFIEKGLDALKDENSILAYVVPSGFLDSKQDRAKNFIAAKGKLIDAYRLPAGTFSTTDVGTDIVIFQKGGTVTSATISDGNWFKMHPEKILGEIKQRTNQFGKLVDTVVHHEDLSIQDELNKIDDFVSGIKKNITVEKQQETKLEITQAEIEEEKAKNQAKIQKYKEKITQLKNTEPDFDAEQSIQGQLINKLESLTDEDIKNQLLWKKENEKKQKEINEEVAERLMEEEKQKSTAQERELFSLNESNPTYTLTNKETGRTVTIQPSGRLEENIKNVAKLKTLSQANEVIEKIKESGFNIHSTASRVIIFNQDKFYDFDADADVSSFNLKTKEWEYNSDNRKLKDWDFKKYVEGGFKITKEMKEFEKIEASKDLRKQNFIFEKLSAASIEVITAKDEFDRILEREELLQKMTKKQSQKYLTSDDVKLLKSWGYNKTEDLEQIQLAMLVSDYRLNDKKIGIKKAVEVLGREKFLSSISRSAFHLSSTYNVDENYVNFDSSVIFYGTERKSGVSPEKHMETINMLHEAEKNAKEHISVLNDILRKESYFQFNEEDEKNFKEQIDDWKNDNSNIAKLVTVGQIPPVMKVLGIADKPIQVQYSTLNKMIRDEPIYPDDKQGHQLSIGDIYAIPAQLADPVMVFKSRTRTDSYVFFTERKDFKNRSILIPLAVNKQKGRIVINEITSMYGKDNEIDFVKKNIDEDNLIYADKKRSLDWELSSQVQFLTQRFSYPNSELSILTKERLVNFLEGNSQPKPQNYITQDGTIYGFTHENKIYLNPDIISSEAAIHEYTHLWDNYTKATNPELWQKGKDIFKNTYLWDEVKNDENYQDIAHDEDLILSECHARITGRIADKVLDKILAENGKLTKDSVINWDKEVFEYISKEFSDNEIDIKSLSEFVSQTMKDFMEGKKIIYDFEQNIATINEDIKHDSLAPVMSSEEFSRLYGKDFTAEEIPIWKATNWEGIIDTSKVSFNELDLLHKSKNYVEIEANKFTHKVLFESGDIGSKIEDYKARIKVLQFNNEEESERQIALYEKNIAELEKIAPSKIPMERLHFGVNSTLAEEFMVDHISAEGEIVQLNLQESFILWAKGQTYAEFTDKRNYHWRGGIDFSTANISQEELPHSITWNDIVEYIDKTPVKAEKVFNSWRKEESEIKAEKAQHKREADEKRMARSETADRLFDRYLHEGLSEELSKKVEAEYNRRFNSYIIPDYSKLPLFIDGMSRTKNGKKFKLYEQQIKGVSFLCNKGNGLLAYDVGVGKTAAGIVATVNQIQTGRSKRPVIVVPNAVYAKWYNDITELFPNIKVNDLYNLNKESTEKYRNAENPHKLDIEENSISLITYEGLKNITFNDHSCENELFNDFSKLLSTDFDGTSVENAKSADNIKSVIGFASQVKNTNFVFFEDCGFDNITVDEAHNFKNLWTVPRPKNKGESNEFSGIPSGKPSARALKLFAMTQYTQRHNDDRNVFLLTATPFTNSPLEVYSMLSYVGRKRLINSGLYSLRDFCNQFAHTKLELGVNSKGEIDQKQVMKDWKELPALQKILTEFIDKVDGEELKEIIRPKKFTHVQEIEMSPLQKQMMQRDTELMNDTSENTAAVIVSMNAMRVGLVAPALADPARYPELKIPPMEQLVETSPKLKFVCDSVIDMYKNHPEKGQFIYMPLGQAAHGIVKDYLIAHGIPKETVEIINGSINNTTEKKDKLTQKFNDPKEKCKILIGGKNTAEGIDLNGNSFVMYNCSLGWNPSETIQAEGRIWRQGNQQGHVHCVYPVMNDSIDSLLYQKHDEKRSRINELWTYKDGDTLNVEDINPEDLKFELIKDPQKRAKLILENGIDTEDFKFTGTKVIQNELNKVNSRMKSFEEVYEKRIQLKRNLEDTEFEIHRLELSIEGYKDSGVEIPSWTKADLKDKRKYKDSYTHQIETINKKFDSWGIKTEEEIQDFIPTLNAQKRELEKQLAEKQNELPKILKRETLRMTEKKVLLPSINEQRKVLTEDIQKNLRPMIEVEPEIRTERFEQMLDSKWKRGEISTEQKDLYSSVGYKKYYEWLDGETENLILEVTQNNLDVEENIELKDEQQDETKISTVNQKSENVESKISSTNEKIENAEKEEKFISSDWDKGLFPEDEIDELSSLSQSLNPKIKNHKVIFYDKDSGINESNNYELLSDAQKSAKKQMKDWELDKAENGFVVFNTETKAIEATHGYFPVEKYFSSVILHANGYKKTELQEEIKLSKIQESVKEKLSEETSKKHFESHVVFATPEKTKKEYVDSYEW